MTCRRLAVAVLALWGLSGCATPPPTDAASHPARGTQPASPTRHQLVQIAARQVGAPYRYGGTGRRGFDCSGLVQYAHRAVGIDIPRTTAGQWRHARTPARDRLLPGDLLFFNIGAAKDRHVAIYEGNGLFIHAPASGKRVGRASLDNPFWHSRLIGARTFL